MIRGWASAILVCVAGAVLLHAQPPERSPQTFRSGTEVVFVDVSVRDGGRPVTGLRAEDFELTDNGRQQRVEGVEAAAVPIDLTLVVDVSGNPRGALTQRTPAARIAQRLQSELADVTRLLRPADRVRLFAIDENLQLVFPFSPAASIAPVPPVAFDGLAALYDTLVAALLHPVEPARRHVIVARTKGNDTISSVTAQAVAAVAERSDALLHLVMMETAYDTDVALTGFQSSRDLIGIRFPTRRFWLPFQRRLFGSRPTHQLTPDGEALARAAEATGGALHKTEVLREPSLAGTFRKAFDDFRSSYVLRYTPQGVREAGWHSIEVKVRGRRSLTVRARRGYGVDGPPASAPAPAVPKDPKTLKELVRAYDLGAYSSVVSAVRAAKDPTDLMADLVDGGNLWPATPSREAAFALELAEPGLFSLTASTREDTYELLSRFSRLIRDPLEPAPFERYWHFALLTMLEGSVRPGMTDAFVDRALERFPGEPRFVLSRAIVTDQKWRGDGTPPPGHVEAARRHYTAAIAMPDIATEARIRFAWFLHRTGRDGEALSLLAQAARQPIGDPSLRYLRLLFTGHALAGLDRPDQAAEAFRLAQAELPATQSARVALMNLLLVRGDRVAAEALAQEIQTDTTRELDPWWSYWQGQYRLYPAAMARVRELAR